MLKEHDFVALYYCSARTRKEFLIWVSKVQAKWERIQARRKKN